MQSYLTRNLEKNIQKFLNIFPVTAILGPRQCGKSTLAKEIIKNHKNAIYLDLERKKDINKIHNIELFMSAHKDWLVCFDEVQLAADIFSELRPIIDENNKPGHLLVLGSASS